MSTAFYRTKCKDLKWQCPGCDKSFALYSKNNQVQHLYTHLPVHERPFKCTKCSACYVQKAQLDTHFGNVHILNQKSKAPSNKNTLSENLHIIRYEITRLTSNRCELVIHLSERNNKD